MAEIAERIERLVPHGLCIIAVDGPGGSGKSTFAGRLHEVLAKADVVHTDDFASWDQPLSWWPRLLEEVLRPARAGEKTVVYRPYDWLGRVPGAPRRLSLRRFLIIEGVSAGRAEFLDYLDYVIWVETPRSERLRRGLERDGDEMLGQWQSWMAEEDKYAAEQKPAERADLVVSGYPTLHHHPSLEVVVLRDRVEKRSGNP
jgi:uridine kinase